MANYPGIKILSELGTRKEMAQAYGVSERTIYRWLNKALKESGTKIPKPRRPRKTTLENFTGTRKQLAQRYGVSERTVYRWLNKARSQGANIPTRAPRSKYPGISILDDIGTRKQLAQSYDVSVSTIDRWRRKAREQGKKDLPTEILTPDQLPEEIITPDMLPEEIITPDMLPEEIITPDMLPEEIITPDMLSEEIITEEPGKDYVDDLQILSELLFNNELLNDNSIFWDIPASDKLKFLDAYIMYQDDQNHTLFYNHEIHDFDYSPDFVSSINIWGDEFETWLRREKGLEDFGADWLDDL